MYKVSSVIINSDINSCLGKCISRVADQNGVSLLYIILEIHHSGREPQIYIDVCVSVNRFVCVYNFHYYLHVVLLIVLFF